MTPRSANWFFPLDPECPKVHAFYAALHNDPMSAAIPSDALDHITIAFEQKHRGACEHCQRYGCENVDAL